MQSFKYLGQEIKNNGRIDTEIYRMCNAATATFNKLVILWNTNNMNMIVKVKILHSMVYSILLYGCETWILTTKTLKKLDAFEMKAYRRILKISYHQHITNIEVRTRIASLNMDLKRLTTMVIQRQLKWYGHVIERLPRMVMSSTARGYHTSHSSVLWMERNQEDARGTPGSNDY